MNKPMAIFIILFNVGFFAYGIIKYHLDFRKMYKKKLKSKHRRTRERYMRGHYKKVNKPDKHARRNNSHYDGDGFGICIASSCNSSNCDQHD